MQAKEAVHCSRAPGSPTHGRWRAHAALFRRARSGCAGACRAARVAVPTAAAAGVPAARKLAPRCSALCLTLRGLSDRSCCQIWPRAAVLPGSSPQTRSRVGLLKTLLMRQLPSLRKTLQPSQRAHARCVLRPCGSPGEEASRFRSLPCRYNSCPQRRRMSPLPQVPGCRNPERTPSVRAPRAASPSFAC